MSDTTIPSNEAGRLAAILAYALYIASIPSAGVLALVGVIIAYVGRDGAGPLARSHLDAAIRIWWIAALWAIGLAIAWVVAAPFIIVLIGFVFWWIIGIIGLIVAIWFTVKSILNLLALLDGRPA